MKKTLHNSDVRLGDEFGYRRLADDEIVQSNDETYGALGNCWYVANDSQVGKPAKKVGGFGVWRRATSNETPVEDEPYSVTNYNIDDFGIDTLDPKTLADAIRGPLNRKNENETLY